MSIRVCIAGATGWAGSALARGVFEEGDMQLVSAVSQNHAGQDLGSFLNISELQIKVSPSVEDALSANPDVLVEYTKPNVAKNHILAALNGGAHVVVGTSGLTDEDYQEIDQTARILNKGVLACGNFSLSAVMLQKFTEMAAKYIPHWEIIDYAHSEKIDAPSGTALELIDRLSKVRESALDVLLEDVHGPKESRGVRLNGSQVHSIRLPGYVISLEALFGLPDQRLSIRFDAGSSAQPYVEGALLAIRKVSGLIGLERGLDVVMDF